MNKTSNKELVAKQRAEKQEEALIKKQMKIDEEKLLKKEQEEEAREERLRLKQEKAALAEKKKKQAEIYKKYKDFRKAEDERLAKAANDMIIKPNVATVWKIRAKWQSQDGYDFSKDLMDIMEEEPGWAENFFTLVPNAREGDIIENILLSGERGRGLYVIIKEKSKLKIVPVEEETDILEPHIGRGFTLGPSFPVGYWAVSNKLQNHDWFDIEPVHTGYLVHIKEKNLNYDETQDISSKEYTWGILEFDGKPDEVVKKIKDLKARKEFYDNNTKAYFVTPTGQRSNIKKSRIYEYLWEE